MGSALYGAMLHSAALDYERGGPVRDVLASAGDRSRIGLRLMGALHYLALEDRLPELAAHLPSTGGDGDAAAAWEAARAAVRDDPSRIAAMLDRTPQTNEVARSMPLTAAFLHVAAETRMPLRIFEIGASAGLNLLWDRYGYRGSTWHWGDASSALQLHNRERSGMPRHLDAAVTVNERRGCDLHPLDPRDAAHRRELLSFVWPDQLERFERLAAALRVAQSFTVPIDAAEGAAWIAAVAPVAGSATIAMHSVITEHMTHAQRDALREAIGALGERATGDAPVAWVRMESAESGYETRATIWPGGGEAHVATSDGHAQDIVWTRDA
jgi:hypothetical protein